MSDNKNNQDDEESSRVIDSFIRRAVDEGRLDPDELGGRSDNVFWDRTTIRAALGGLAVLILVNLFFFYSMRLEQVDNTADWQPERRGYLVEYREGQEQSQTTANSPTTLAAPQQTPAQTTSDISSQSVPEMSSNEQALTSAEQSPIEQSQPVAEPDVSDTAEPAESSGVTGAQGSPTDQVRALIDMWAQSWSFKTVDDYLSLYSEDFVSQGGAPYEPWAELRRERITAPDWIHVSVDELKIFVNADSAVAEFVQVYTSSDFSSDSRKTLVLQPEDNGWKIIRETVHAPQ